MKPARALLSLTSLTLTGLIAVSAITGTTAAQAADGPDRTSGKTTWSVQPSTPTGPTTRTSFDYDVVPGTDLVDYVGVNNYSNKPLTLQVYASDAFNTSSGGTDILAGSQKPVDVGAWVKFPKRAVTVAARSRVDLPFRVEVPTNATPGDHVGAVVASLTSVTTDGKGRDVSVDRRVGARINLRVQGALKPALAISGVHSSYAASANPLGGTLTVTYQVRNSGNVQLSARQSVKVKALGIIGVKSVTLPMLDRVLPGNTVTQTQRITGVPAGVRLASTITLVPFSASDDLGVTPATVTAETSTWAIAWSLLALIALLVAAGFGVRRLRRRRAVVSAAKSEALLEAAREQVRAEVLAENAHAGQDATVTAETRDS